MPKISLEDYAKQYTQTLIETAARIGPETLMGQACLVRCDHIVDFIKAWKEYIKG